MENLITLDIGGTNIRAAHVIFGEGGLKIVRKLKQATSPEPIEVVQQLTESILRESTKDIDSVAISVAGIVNPKEGILLKSPNIAKLEGTNFRKLFEERYHLRCIIENDANAAAYGEKVAGAGREFEDFVLLTLGTGIGGGIVINGRLLRVAAEIGHTIISSEGPQCPCGNVGCLETLASATAVIARAISEIENGNQSALRSLYHGNFYKMNAEDIYKAALDGDMLARTVLKDAGKALGIGIANVVNVFSPQAIILTGGMIGAWNIYVEAAIREASRRAFKELISRVKILPSQLGDDAGLTGIAYLASETE